MTPPSLTDLPALKQELARVEEEFEWITPGEWWVVSEVHLGVTRYYVKAVGFNVAGPLYSEADAQFIAQSPVRAQAYAALLRQAIAAGEYLKNLTAP